MNFILAARVYLRTVLRNEDGVTAIEYGLIASLVALALIVGAKALGTNLNTLFTTISTDV